MGPGGVQMRIRFIRTALTLLLATTGFSQIVSSQEASDAAIGQHSEDGSTNIDAAASTERSLNATKPIPNLSSSNQALTFRRNARFYSWRGRCYTQDRDENWYELDGRLC
jgi:hypothetical protein